MSNFCESFTCLPRPGGALQQPQGLMRRMLLYRNFRAAAQDQDAPWRLNNPDAPPLADATQRLLALGQDVRLLVALRWMQDAEDA